MERKEAEKLGGLIMQAGKLRGAKLRALIANAILSAYRKGAEEMRERCAAALDKRRGEIHSDRELDELHAAGQAKAYGYQEQESVLERMAARIRSLPLTDDPEESNEQAPPT